VGALESLSPVWAQSAKAYVGEAPPDMALADTDVSPEAAMVYLDGAEVGDADDFDGTPAIWPSPPDTTRSSSGTRGIRRFRSRSRRSPGASTTSTGS
jgi:hypothetical protein